MKVAKVVHNPTAGKEEINKKELVQLIESRGFECRYASTKKKGWKKMGPQVDFVIAAGGDGTVRKIVKKLLKRNILEESLPIALLPLGTANNIAKTLEITGTIEEIIDVWKNAGLKKFDVGKVSNLEETDFFLEGLGFGLFPYLVLEMRKSGKIFDDPDLELKTALAILHEIVLSYGPQHCELEIDGATHSGQYLMAEIMNTRSIGPNLVLAPDADPGDGELEVVLIPEKYKDRFATYLTNKIAGNEEDYRYHTLRGKNIAIRWEGTHVHVDDKILKIPKQTLLNVELREGLLQFLVQDKMVRKAS